LCEPVEEEGEGELRGEVAFDFQAQWGEKLDGYRIYLPVVRMAFARSILRKVRRKHLSTTVVYPKRFFAPEEIDLDEIVFAASAPQARAPEFRESVDEVWQGFDCRTDKNHFKIQQVAWVKGLSICQWGVEYIRCRRRVEFTCIRVVGRRRRLEYGNIQAFSAQKAGCAIRSGDRTNDSSERASESSPEDSAFIRRQDHQAGDFDGKSEPFECEKRMRRLYRLGQMLYVTSRDSMQETRPVLLVSRFDHHTCVSSRVQLCLTVLISSVFPTRTLDRMPESRLILPPSWQIPNAMPH
jgi:hypothetical protein